MFITQSKIYIGSASQDMPSERKAASKAVEKGEGCSIVPELAIEAQMRIQIQCL